jgi:hypothetical protein
VLRSAWLVACVASALAVMPRVAHAGDMDLALSRFRLTRETPQGVTNCPRSISSSTYCADQELFERLMAELAVAMAPPVAGVARTIGPRAFHIGVGTTVTSIDGGQLHWIRGTEGDRGVSVPVVDPDGPELLGRPGAGLGFNEAPQAVLAWNHVQVRKGLPFGLEAAALLGQGMNTSMWTLGAALKWGVFEGFRTGGGQLPDVSLQVAANRSVGSSQAELHVYSFDLAFSKPFVIEHTWALSPFLGLQGLLVDAQSGVIDLTPGGPGDPPQDDAYASCRPLPGHQTGSNAGTVVCMTPGETGADFAHDVVFDPVRNARMRMFLGAQTRYDRFTLAASLLFDLLVPSIEAAPPRPHLDSDRVARQVAFSVSVGAVL